MPSLFIDARLLSTMYPLTTVFNRRTVQNSRKVVRLFGGVGAHEHYCVFGENMMEAFASAERTAAFIVSEISIQTTLWRASVYSPTEYME